MSAPRVLIVDDSLTVLTFQKTMLRQEGYELATADNGRAALDSVRASPPDLVLLDVMMPEMGGIECCRRLKLDEATRDIPVIMVTTKGDHGTVTSAYAAGCDDFITKPIDKVELTRKVKAHLERRASGAKK